MGTTAAAIHGHVQGGRAAPPGGAGRAARRGWAWLLAWLARARYRPERRYMRGGRGGDATAPSRVVAVRDADRPRAARR
jgi:hypothetical protein